jgi:hypothetical protein
MTATKKTVIDCKTKEETEVALTAEEITEISDRQAKAAAKDAEEQAEKDQKTAEESAAKATLGSLKGKSVSSMTDSELKQYVGALGQLLNVVDENNEVK